MFTLFSALIRSLSFLGFMVYLGFVYLGIGLLSKVCLYRVFVMYFKILFLYLVKLKQ